MSWLILLFTTATACYLRNGTFIPDPAPGNLCIECKLLGYVLANGSCSTTVEYQPQVYLIQPTCDPYYCRVNGICKDSYYGVLCDECNKLGWLNGVICECYVSDANPYQRCIHSSTILQTTLYIDEKYRSWECIPHQDHIKGCFKLGLVPSDYKYGTTLDPPIPNQCCSEIYGPEPQQLVSAALDACNSFGGPDPNSDDITKWHYCSNHGTWDSTTYSCICSSPNWQADFIGFDLYGNPAYSCNKCAPGWGRLDSDMCGAIVAPSTKTGRNEICAGNGDYDFGQCNCYDNITHGHWELTPFTFESTITLGNGTEYFLNVTNQVCAKCKSPFIGSDCLEIPFCSIENCPTSYLTPNQTFYWASNNFTSGIFIDQNNPCENDLNKNAVFKCRELNCTHFYKAFGGRWEFYQSEPVVNSTALYRRGRIYKTC